MNGAPVFSCEVDLVIVGGGIAGLWLANVLTDHGYKLLVLEGDRLGGQQTLASQGVIHGGMKYALTGNLTGASHAISGMPERWRACLEGSGEIDLSTVSVLSNRYYLFAEASTLGRLTGFFASKSLRGRIDKLNPSDYPPVFRAPGFNAVVYALDDLVLDTRSLMTSLQAKLEGRIYRHELKPEQIHTRNDGIDLEVNGGAISARQLILCAGAGTQTLLDGLQLATPEMQIRPLHQVVVRHRHPHPLYAHCVTGIRSPEPRLTITSHADGKHWLWYLGGRLASDGVDMDSDALVAHARAELKACLPWISLDDAQFSTVRVDRAEPKQSGRQRPDEAFACASGNTLICWPTKLSLAPDLADKVLGLLKPPSDRGHRAHANLSLPAPSMGQAPWET
ncbi:MAG: FAD-dependent oxidoreductase [Gammaproteobacteria bacterium]|nr:FAD-dependent oxidoreductase [Gammaproteobacteria bacterium]